MNSSAPNGSKWTPAKKLWLLAAATLAITPIALYAQSVSVSSTNQSSSDRWLHVRVIDSSNKGETVRVNVPLDLAEKVLPAINKDRLHGGKIKIDSAKLEDVDCRALLEAVKSAKDGEYVTVQSNENDVKVSKSGGVMFIHVTEKQTDSKTGKAVEHSKVEVKVPMKVVEALFSAGKDELDVLAALRALSAHGDTELVSVKDSENTVRVWLDSKNVSD